MIQSLLISHLNPLKQPFLVLITPNVKMAIVFHLEKIYLMLLQQIIKNIQLSMKNALLQLMTEIRQYLVLIKLQFQKFHILLEYALKQLLTLFSVVIQIKLINFYLQRYSQILLQIKKFAYKDYQILIHNLHQMILSQQKVNYLPTVFYKINSFHKTTKFMLSQIITMVLDLAQLELTFTMVQLLLKQVILQQTPQQSLDLVTQQIFQKI